MDDLGEGDLPDFGGGGAEIVEGEELANLISFANLENVVKHIIGKFKSIESHNDSTNDTIQQIRKDLETRATNVSVEDFAAELGTRVEGIKAVLQAQKENITSLETQLERSRATSNVIEKKLDACVKEKAVQDRLIRETQDTLQDKVAIAELNMFEAKFAGYTTKLELQEVINSMSHCARVDVTDRIAESVRALSTCFDDYSRTAKVEQQLQALRDWVGDELQHYAKARAMNDRIDELQARIYDQSLAFERAHSMADDKTRALSDRVTSIYQELNNDLHQRALADDLREVKNGLKKYALKAETDAFQLDCVPKLRFCVDSIAAFDDRLRAQDDAIQRVDEVLLDKAGKYDIVVVSSRVEQCLPKEAAAREHTKLYQRLEWLNKKFEEYMNGEAARLDQFRPPDYGPMLDDLSARVTLKADKADLVEMYQLKANRIDTDELAKLQETIHRQLEYLSVTTFGLSKLALTEAKTGDSKTIRTQQKAQVLMQSEALWHWILHNEPPPNLETLRPPPGRHQSKQQGQADSEGDVEKRRMDDHKRAQLEKKLGLPGT